MKHLFLSICKCIRETDTIPFMYVWAKLIPIWSHRFIVKRRVIDSNYTCQANTCLILSTRLDSFWKVVVSFHCRLQFREHRRLLFAIARKQQWGTKRRSENRQYPEERTAVTRATERKSKKRRQPARRVEKLSFAMDTTEKRAFSFWARIHVWTSRPPTRRRRRRPRRQKVTRK